MAPDPCRFRLLGRVDLCDAAGRSVLSVLSQPKRIGILAYLAVEGRGGWVQRDSVLAVFWPEASEADARASLRGAVYALRQSLGAGIIESGGAALRLADGLMDCDAVRFLDACAARDWVLAVSTYSGGFMDGFHLSGLESFEEWHGAVGRRLEYDACRAALALADAAEREGGPGAAIPHLRRATELAPADEASLRRLLRAMSATGNRTGAIAAYEAWSAELARTLGVEPSAETLAEVERIGLAAAPVPDRVRTAPALPARPPSPESVSGAGIAQPVVGTGDPVALRRVLTARRAGMALLGAAVLITVGVWRATRATLQPEAEPLPVAVFPFDVETSAPAYYGDAVAYLLADWLERTPARAVIDAGSVRAHLAASGDRAPAGIAVLLGTGRFVSGTIAVDGGRVVLEAELRDATSPRRVYVRARAEGDTIQLPLVAARLAAELFAGATPTVGDVVHEMTASVMALEPFVAGEDHYSAGRFADAAAAFAHAIALDSTFARAYIGQSTTADWLGEVGLARNAADRALIHSYRLSPLGRQFLDAWRAEIWGDLSTALQSYQVLTTRAPTVNLEAWLRLGELRFHWGALLGATPAGADSAFSQALWLVPDHAGALMHRIRFAAYHSEPEVTRELVRRVRALGPAPFEVLQLDLLEPLLADRPVPAGALDRLAAASASVEWNVLAGLAAMLPSPYSLERLVAALPPDEDVARAVDRGWLRARLLAGTGRYAAADSVLEAVADVAPFRAIEFRAALLLTRPQPSAVEVAAVVADLRRHAGRSSEQYARDSRVDGLFEPRRVLVTAMLERSLERVPPPPLDAVAISRTGTRYTAQFERLLFAWNLLRDHDAAGALGVLGPPEPEPDLMRPGPMSYPAAMSRWLRAEALVAVGRDQDALVWLAGFPEPNGSDLMYLGQAAFRRAEILERTGRAADAAAGYRRALHLWEHADAEVAPLVNAARRGLARLGR